MTECITKWRQNGFVNSKGTYVADANLFNQIGILTGHLNVQGVEVTILSLQFSHNPFLQTNPYTFCRIFELRYGIFPLETVAVSPNLTLLAKA